MVVGGPGLTGPPSFFQTIWYSIFMNGIRIDFCYGIATSQLNCYINNLKPLFYTGNQVPC